MSSRYCAHCEIHWPPNQEIRSGLGGRSLRPINVECPVCGSLTRHDIYGTPSDEDERAVLLDQAKRHADREAREAEFDSYYADYALAEFNKEIAEWPVASA